MKLPTVTTSGGWNEEGVRDFLVSIGIEIIFI